MVPAAENLTGHRLYSETPKFQEAMLKDIGEAKQYIYLETYKFGNDEAGRRFLAALTEKAREGVKVKVLVDSWGVTYDESFFSELVAAGGEARFFMKIRISFDFFTKNHRRNHRKLLIIDDHISYIGSANITAYSASWRESVLRLSGPVAVTFRKTFLQSYRIYKQYFFKKSAYKKAIHYDEFEIVQDVPSISRQRIKLKLEKMIRRARKEIVIITPYFLPGFMLRKLLANAAMRGVSVTVIVPRHSDVRAVDLLSNKYLGYYYKNNIHVMYYLPANLHAKVLMIDNQEFGLGSPNFDYRSFRYMFEIMLIGRHEGIMKEVNQFIAETLENSIPFDHAAWLRRPRIDKALGWLLLPFRHLF